MQADTCCDHVFSNALQAVLMRRVFFSRRTIRPTAFATFVPNAWAVRFSLASPAVYPAVDQEGRLQGAFPPAFWEISRRRAGKN